MMKKLGIFLLAAAGMIAGSMAAQNVYNYFSPGGALGGTGSSQTVNLAAGNSFILGNLPVNNLNGGTGALSTTFWSGNGTWATPAGSTGANPSASVGTTAVNGSSGNFMRADAAPAINQAMAPTMTGNWIWTPSSGTPMTINLNGTNVGIQEVGAAATASKYAIWQETGQTYWQWYSPASSNDIRIYNNGYGDVLGFGGDGGMYTTGQTDKGAGTLNTAGLYALGTRVPKISSGTCHASNSQSPQIQLLSGASNVASCVVNSGGAGIQWYQFTFISSYSSSPSCTAAWYYDGSSGPTAAPLYATLYSLPTTTSVSVITGSQTSVSGDYVSFICSALYP